MTKALYINNQTVEKSSYFHLKQKHPARNVGHIWVAGVDEEVGEDDDIPCLGLHLAPTVFIVGQNRINTFVTDY